MCGIAAIFNYRTGEPIDRAELLRIRDAMSLRGPDGCGDWVSPEGRIGLGHRRLSIIDLSEAGAQPMKNRDGSLVITFNGEIYNYRQLRIELEQKGYRFQSTSDTEVLLHLYDAEGEAMVGKLRGMYAFAIWDDRKQGLFIARDPYGIKPLYLADDGKTLRAASQVKALLAGGHIDTAPEPAGHVGFFLWGHVPEPYTLYRGIRAIPAGHSLWLDQSGNRRQNEFCSIPKILAEAESSHASRITHHASPPEPFPHSQLSTLNPQPRRDPQPSTLNSQLSSALRATVKHHLIADVPVGVFLSSGLDSTTVAALAAEQGGTLRTVTLGFEEFRGTPNDESPLAAEVAARYGARHQTVWVGKQDFRDNFSRIMQAMDQPSCDGINSYFVSLAAARAGLKVALSGVGGDELFGGYPSFREIPRTVRSFQHFSISAFQHFSVLFRAVSAPLLRRFTSPKYASLFEYGGTYGGAYLLRRGMFMPWELPEVLDPDLVREGWQELQTLARLEETTSGIESPRARVSALESCWYMRNQLLRDTDWAGMSHSLEVRTPLVDATLLRELAPQLAGANPLTKRDMAQCVSVPPSTLNSRLSTSSLPPLPASVLDRPKTGFSIPVRDWLLNDSRPSTLNPQPSARDRGLRGWAKEVYSQFPGARPAPSHRRQRAEDGGQRTEGKGQSPNSASHITHHASRITHHPSRITHHASRILVFRIGQLGDTLVALPAIWAVRKHFPEAHLALLCDRHPGKQYVLASDLFHGTGIFDEFLSYPVTEAGELLKPWRMVSLLAAVRKRQFDTLVYLAPTCRSSDQIARDRRFFSLAGISRFIGMEGFTPLPPKVNDTPLPETPSESALLLKRLSASGLTVPPAEQSRRDLMLVASEEESVTRWLKGLPPDGGRPWVAIAPGSKMPAKRWPLERFADVVRGLIAKFDIWPVVFGGEEDRQIGNSLLATWRRGHNAAGALGLRPAVAALKRCVLYIGNDTGTMHMAAAADVPCVAIFSSRDRPGLWYPHGDGHRVLRSRIDCEGCGLAECLDRHNECLNRIAAPEVLAACEALLANAEMLKPEDRGRMTKGRGRKTDAG